MTLNYVFWAAQTSEEVVRLTSLTGFDDDFEIDDGVAHAHDFPADAHFHMHVDWPTSTVLADRLSNTSSLVVVSSKLKDFLADKLDRHTELLPVTVFDHKGKALKTPFYIVHPVGQVELLDFDACEVVDEVGPRIEEMAKFVTLEKPELDDRVLLRAEHLARYVMIRRDLTRLIDKAGFTGNRWVEPEELTGREIPADLTDL
ncbi:MAG TPA: hypothetical protein VFN67_14400 [Polyangiales bacterium]|nr:hypothetical protein [Polyangiales bacterium]